MRRLRAFGAFWYDFVVGDDWLVAAGVVVGLAATYGLHRAGAPAWWLLPAVLVVLLPVSLSRAIRGSGHRVSAHRGPLLASLLLLPRTRGPRTPPASARTPPAS